MVYNLKCKTNSGIKVNYEVAGGPMYNLLTDLGCKCIEAAREHVVRSDLANVVLTEDEHLCISGNIREEGLNLLRTGPHTYKVVDDSYLKSHKIKSKRSLIKGIDLENLLRQYNGRRGYKTTQKPKKRK